jgi:hypothetical protein
VALQVPPEQTCPVEHAWPHPPQFEGSTDVSTHAPPHVAIIPEHATVHAPCTQAWPAPHATPQAPQFRGSEAVSPHASAVASRGTTRPSRDPSNEASTFASVVMVMDPSLITTVSVASQATVSSHTESARH